MTKIFADSLRPDETERAWLDAAEHLLLDGYVEPMAALLKHSQSDVPRHARNVLARYLESDFYRNQDQRGKDNAKISPAQRKRLVRVLERLHENFEILFVVVNELADEMGCEPSGLRKELNCKKRDALQLLAIHFKLSEATIKTQIEVSRVKFWAKLMAGKIDAHGRPVRASLRDPGRLEAVLVRARTYIAHPEIYLDAQAAIDFFE